MQKSEKANEKSVLARGGKTVYFLGGALVLAALLLVLFLIIYPRARAAAEMKQIRADLAGEIAALQLTDPMGGIEVLLEGDAARETAALLRCALDGAKFAASRDSRSGNWDVRVIAILPDGARVSLYLTDSGEIYFSRGLTQFVFSLPDASLPEAVRGMLG